MIHLGNIYTLGIPQVAEKALLLADEIGPVKVCRSHGGGLCVFGADEIPSRTVLFELNGDESAHDVNELLLKKCAA